MSLPSVTDETFQREVTDSELPVFVKFSAVWCGPCKAVAPIIDGLAKEYDGEMKFVEVDVDASPGLRENHMIRGMPTYVIMKDGKEIARDMGQKTRTRFAEMIENAIEGQAA